MQNAKKIRRRQIKIMTLNQQKIKNETDTAISIHDADIINNTFHMKDISLNIRKGFVTAVTGRNSSGKTTLIEAMAGMHGITKGEIHIEGYSLTEQPNKAKENIGFIFHKCPFGEQFSAKDCMNMYGRFYKGFNKEKFTDLCREMNVEMLKAIRKMSKGQAVKLQLAFALAHNSRILLFDDAMEGLDPVFRIEVKKMLSDIMTDGQHTVVISTKLPEDLEGIADYVVTLRDGRVESEKDIEELMEQGGIKEYFKGMEEKSTAGDIEGGGKE